MSILSSIVSGAASFFGGREANAANQQSAREQMQFQQDMSSTAYQRAMADMKKAGLNPILAYKQGPASSPTGQSYRAQNVLGATANSAVDAYSKTTAAQNTKADTKLKGSDNALRKEQLNRAKHETNSAHSTARKNKMEAEMAESHGPSALGKGIGSIERMFETWYNRITGGNSAKSTNKNSRGEPLKVIIRPSPGTGYRPPGK